MPCRLLLHVEVRFGYLPPLLSNIISQRFERLKKGNLNAGPPGKTCEEYFKLRKRLKINPQFKEEEPEKWTDVHNKGIKGKGAAGASITEGGEVVTG